jgi:Leucine-rich repeat (LRR) protein
MDKLKILTTGFLFFCIAAYGQDNSSVVVFEGRKVPFMQKKVLDLSYQNLREVPIEASNQEIEVLILDNNNIEKLPNGIANLKNLKVLSVRNNNLIKVNSSISFCENLEQLYLSGNKNLRDLPSLSTCEKIKIIDVVDTGINEVPGWVEMMDSLFYFKFTKYK